MGTKLGANRGPATPTLKLDTIGHTIDGHVIDVDIVPAYIYGTNEQATTKNGKPKTQDKVTVLVRRGSGLIVAIDEHGDPIKDTDGKSTYRPVVDGDIGVIFIEGPARWDPDLDAGRPKGDPKSWSGARDDAGGLECGDVIRWRYVGDHQGQGAQPRKLRLFQLRRPKPEEQPVADRCEVLRREKNSVQLQPAHSGAVYGDEEPF